MREIILDTETTGFDPLVGHRLCEVACIELMNHLPTGRTFQRYVNPERDMPEDAFRVHGLSAEFLAKHPTFSAVAQELLAFIGEDKLVIHNADFDLAFLNAEFLRLDLPQLPRNRALDTVQLARRKFPGSPASLDALCKRFGIDNSARTLHGALLDCELLAEVYLELMGGRQPGLTMLAATATAPVLPTATARTQPTQGPRPPRAHAPTADEQAAHTKMLEKLKDPLWRQ